MPALRERGRREMSVETYVKLHFEFAFRDEQKPGDDFEFYLGGDSYWLDRAEVEELVERAKAALEVYDHANVILRVGADGLEAS